MKTHELAKVLRDLAKVLASGPNIEIGDIDLSKRLASRASRDNNDRSQWQALFSLDKKKLVSFVNDFNLPINLRPRDAARDVLAKIIKCFEADPELARKVRNEVIHGDRKTSPELMSALSALIPSRR